MKHLQCFQIPNESSETEFRNFVKFSLLVPQMSHEFGSGKNPINNRGLKYVEYELGQVNFFRSSTEAHPY